MKKKGFTLVELLAVVVILAVISIITIPIIINLINAAQKGALKDSAMGLIKSGDLYYSLHQMKDKEFEDTDFSVVDGKFTSEKKLDYKGKVKTAYLRIFSDGEMALCVDDGHYSIVKSVEQNIKDVEPTESICTGEFDEATMSYTTSGSHNYGEILLNVKAYSSVDAVAAIKGRNDDIGVITSEKITGYYVSYTEPEDKKEGMVWIVSKINTGVNITSAKGAIPVSYVLQYTNGEWIIKDSYLYNGKEEKWERLEFYETSDYVYNYSYTGKYETFKAPLAGTYQIELWGAQGATYGVAGGLGGYTKGDIYLEEGEELYIYVGGAGSTAANTWSNGGWNGGGGTYNGQGGGGATDVRLTKTSALTTWNEFNSLKDRIMVAAGGGGAGYYSGSYYATGGAGGGFNGARATDVSMYSFTPYLGTGGTQTSGGTGLGNGGFGVGANGQTYNNDGQYGRAGAGGGGWFGGGSGRYYSSVYEALSGGGGSSFISGYDGCNALNLDTSTSSSQLYFTNQSVHQSGKKFTNATMATGINSGNGKAIITFKLFGTSKLAKKDMQPGESVIYNYTGSYEAFHVKTSGLYKVECWGASGKVYGVSAGAGGYTKGEIELQEGQTLFVYVGQQGLYNKGGWNGGGDSMGGQGGGGATDIRVNVVGGDWNDFDSLKNRIMVAAGGGGSGYYSGSYYSYGGAGGGMTGLNAYTPTGNYSQTPYFGKGATQNAGGSGISSGGFGYGGSGSIYNNDLQYGHPGGGGGGWYGGGGGRYFSSVYEGNAGGGGSSYISGHAGGNAVRASSTSGNIIHLGVNESPTGYVFKNTQIKTGVNSGNGKAVITLLEKSEVEVNNTDVYTFEYDGSYVPFTIPKTGYYQIELWGAQGYSYGVGGGAGGYTSGKIYFNKGTKLYVYVGGQGEGTRGGFGGGGSAGNLGTGGGGATDIRMVAGNGNDTESLASRIMVAGGGGGSGYYNGSYCSTGGAGGGLTGSQGSSCNTTNQPTTYMGSGGTQVSGGGGIYVGSFGYGGTCSTYNNDNQYGKPGSGGGGWYGGGGGRYYSSVYEGSSGGGGSSYISGHAGCVGVSKQGIKNADSYSTISDSYSYTGYKFTDTVMIDGNGYEWTTVKGSYTGMPQYDGIQTMTGNTGNGFAKFTYLGK